MLDRSFAPMNRALARTPQTAAPTAPIGAVIAPPATAHQGRGDGALALLDRIELRDAALRINVEPEFEPIDPDVNDGTPDQEFEPLDPSITSAMDEDDEDERAVDDEDEDEEERDVDITVVDVDEETELPDDDEMRAAEPSIVDLDDDIEPGEIPPADPQVPEGADPAPAP